METARGALGSWFIAVATAFVIVAVALPLFVNPIWVAFEQDRAQAGAWTGFADADLRYATNEILADLVLGPPAFDVAVGGRAVLEERERAHMRDVRGVFIGFFAVATVLGGTALVIAARRGAVDRSRTWRSIRAGALGLLLTLVGAGTIALLAFDALFEVFHRVLFPGGSYAFDPATERLVQLFPFQFWQESAIAVGVACIVLAVVVTVVASRRATVAAAETVFDLGVGSPARVTSE